MIERFTSLSNRLGIGEPIETFRLLKRRYSEPHRAYHNLAHIESCLDEFDEVMNLFPYPEIVEYAIWFHDVVYDTKAKDNEGKSIELAIEIAKKSKLLESDMITVSSLILATTHCLTPKNLMQETIIDVDLSILGKPIEIFRKYNDGIRQEYSWVPETQYVNGRTKILRSFLERKNIYYTRYFRQKYEKQARTNLETTLKQLDQFK